MKFSYLFLFFLLISAICIGGMYSVGKDFFKTKYEIGQKIDSLNGVYVYYNGGFGNIEGRNLTSDGFNYGLKWQSVEYTKRFYFQHLDHKMPNSYGHAKDFFNPQISDRKLMY